MTRLGRSIATVALAGVAVGCATPAHATEKNKVYAVTRAAADSHGGLLIMPLSVPIETALLPVTVPWTIVNHLKAARARARDGQGDVAPAPPRRDGETE